jgi:hypothetical protein
MTRSFVVFVAAVALFSANAAFARVSRARPVADEQVRRGRVARHRTTTSFRRPPPEPARDSDDASEASMLGVCFLLWCVGQSPATGERVSATNDIRDSTRTERIVAYERSWLIGGFVHQNSPDGLFGGALPLNITAFHGRLSIDGGGVIASARVPISGTQANFMARVHGPHGAAAGRTGIIAQ